jgi:hypothetical protein
LGDGGAAADGGVVTPLHYLIGACGRVDAIVDRRLNSKSRDVSPPSAPIETAPFGLVAKMHYLGAKIRPESAEEIPCENLSRRLATRFPRAPPFTP